MQDTSARATHSAYAAARPRARATIGYLVYKRHARSAKRQLCSQTLSNDSACMQYTFAVVYNNSARTSKRTRLAH